MDLDHMGTNLGYLLLVFLVCWSRFSAIMSRLSNVLDFAPQNIPNGAFLIPESGLGTLLQFALWL